MIDILNSTFKEVLLTPTGTSWSANWVSKQKLIHYRFASLMMMVATAVVDSQKALQHGRWLILIHTSSPFIMEEEIALEMIASIDISTNISHL